MSFKRLILLTVFFVTMAPAMVSAQEPRFFSMLNDVPLMPGLYEVAKDSMSFDKAEGRIVETSAASETLNTGQIKAFYASALPQLGWIASGAGDSYVRGGEKLSLRLESKGALNIVHLSLSPAP